MKEQLTVADYEEVLADHRRLVRELDVLLNGEHGAAKQASLCDIVGQLKRQKCVPSSKTDIYKAAETFFNAVCFRWPGAVEQIEEVAGPLREALKVKPVETPESQVMLYELLASARAELPDPDFVPDEDREIRLRSLRERIDAYLSVTDYMKLRSAAEPSPDDPTTCLGIIRDGVCSCGLGAKHAGKSPEKASGEPNYNLPPWHLSKRVPGCECHGCSSLNGTSKQT